MRSLLSPSLLLFIMLYCFSGVSASDELNFGRLFTTDKERVLLDAVRDKQSKTPLTENVEDEGDTSLLLRGYVMQNDGSGTVWVNDANSLASKTLGNGVIIKGVLTDHQLVNVALPGGSVKIKPGQKYISSTGQVVESFHDAKASPSKTHETLK